MRKVVKLHFYCMHTKHDGYWSYAMLWTMHTKSQTHTTLGTLNSTNISRIVCVLCLPFRLSVGRLPLFSVCVCQSLTSSCDALRVHRTIPCWQTTPPQKVKLHRNLCQKWYPCLWSVKYLIYSTCRSMQIWNLCSAYASIIWWTRIRSVSSECCASLDNYQR